MSDDTDYIAEAIAEMWGQRCSEYAEGCACCEAWKQYDEWKDASEQARWQVVKAKGWEAMGDPDDWETVAGPAW